MAGYDMMERSLSAFRPEANAINTRTQIPGVASASGSETTMVSHSAESGFLTIDHISLTGVPGNLVSCGRAAKHSDRARPPPITPPGFHHARTAPYSGNTYSLRRQPQRLRPLLHPPDPHRRNRGHHNLRLPLAKPHRDPVDLRRTVHRAAGGSRQRVPAECERVGFSAADVGVRRLVAGAHVVVLQTGAALQAGGDGICG